MKKLALFLILISCADKHHDFKEGEYLEEVWYKGELLKDMDEPVLRNGYVYNDTLFFVHTTYRKEAIYDEIKCKEDTQYYVRYIIKIPTNQKYDSAAHHRIQVECQADGLKRRNDKFNDYFKVKQDYIEIISCPEDGKDCNPIDSWVQRLYFPKNK